MAAHNVSGMDNIVRHLRSCARIPEVRGLHAGDPITF